MGDTLFGKPYGLTHEEMLKAHHVLTAIATAKKTPYQLDLEIMDRKPDIVPKAGDKVKIKSREWYEKWREPSGTVWVLYSFNKDMAKLCGQVLTVKEVSLGSKSWLFKLKEDETYKIWSLEMFEEVYPQESSKEEKCTKGLDSSSISASALETQLTGTSAFPAINSIQGIGIPYNLGKLSRQGVGLEAWPDTSPRTNLPQSCFGRISAVVHQDFLKKEEPELQTIKRHRFIKLENL